jgi:hypothetical protein
MSFLPIRLYVLSVEHLSYFKSGSSNTSKRSFLTLQKFQCSIDFGYITSKRLTLTYAAWGRGGRGSYSGKVYRICFSSQNLFELKAVKKSSGSQISGMTRESNCALSLYLR